jgi:hypothetical protein
MISLASVDESVTRKRPSSRTDCFGLDQKSLNFQKQTTTKEWLGRTVHVQVADHLIGKERNLHVET